MPGPLAMAWRERLPTHGYVDLHERLDDFPELVDAARPPRFELRLLDQCYVAAEGDEDISAELEAELIPPRLAPADADEQGWVHVELVTADGTGLIHTLDIPASIQGGGLGSLVIAQLAELGDQLGLETLELEAGKLGRWAWMRCGFDFSDDEDREQVIAAAGEFAERLGLEVELEGIEHSWDFLDLDQPVSAEAVRDAGGPIIDPGAAEVPLSKALLLGPNEDANTWFGRLTLDAKSDGRVRLADYVLGI